MERSLILIPKYTSGNPQLFFTLECLEQEKAEYLRRISGTGLYPVGMQYEVFSWFTSLCESVCLKPPSGYPREVEVLEEENGEMRVLRYVYHITDEIPQIRSILITVKKAAPKEDQSPLYSNKK